jgi:hypothetical protein
MKSVTPSEKDKSVALVFFNGVTDIFLELVVRDKKIGAAAPDGTQELLSPSQIIEDALREFLIAKGSDNDHRPLIIGHTTLIPGRARS